MNAAENKLIYSKKSLTTVKAWW